MIDTPEPAGLVRGAAGMFARSRIPVTRAAVNGSPVWLFHPCFESTIAISGSGDPLTDVTVLVGVHDTYQLWSCFPAPPASVSTLTLVTPAGTSRARAPGRSGAVEDLPNLLVDSVDHLRPDAAGQPVDGQDDRRDDDQDARVFDHVLAGLLALEACRSKLPPLAALLCTSK